MNWITNFVFLVVISNQVQYSSLFKFYLLYIIEQILCNKIIRQNYFLKITVKNHVHY